jgi:hypothetical protein
MTETDWLNMFAQPDGIINDTTATGALALSRIDAGNIARIGVGSLRLNGYTLEVTAAEDLTVSTAAGTYLIAVKYDPALNVPDGAGAASDLGPCRLVIGTSFSTAAGEAYAVLYQITRAASQALTAATVVDNRRWTGPMNVMPALPSATISPAQLFARGSVMVETDADATAGRIKMSMRLPNAAGSALAWRPLTEMAEQAFPAAGTLVAFDAPARMELENGRVFLHGTLKRSSGALATGNEVTLGTLPAGWRPPYYTRFMCWGYSTTSNPVIAPVKVIPGGAVIMYDSPTNVDWIDLSVINFKVA